MAEIELDRFALIKALQAQNAVNPSGIIQTHDERVLVEVSGKFLSEQDFLQINFAIGNRMLGLGDLATVSRGYTDPPQPLFRVNGRDAIGLAISMRSAGDMLALERNLRQTMRQLTATLPIGIDIHLVADQPKVVHDAVHDFMEALWEAIAIVLGISFLSLGVRAGLVVACSIPLVLACVFVPQTHRFQKLTELSYFTLSVSVHYTSDLALFFSWVDQTHSNPHNIHSAIQTLSS